MLNAKFPIQAFITAAVFVAATVQASTADLRAQMSASEFEAAGLHKLSAQELKRLAEWIEAQAGRDPSAARSVDQVRQTEDASVTQRALKTDSSDSPKVEVEQKSPQQRFGQEQLIVEPKADVPESIASRINGNFRGWTGNTVFRLENGQVWQQRVGGKYRSPSRTNPEVVVERGRFGYYLKVVETGRSVGVKRIR